MKNGKTKTGRIYIFGLLLISGFLFTSADGCGSAGFDSVIGKPLKLAELRLSGKTIIINRNRLTSESMGDFFTMNIEAGQISGKAAPNQYSAAYTLGEKDALTIQAPVVTQAAMFFDPEQLREEDYLRYLGKVTRWGLNKNRLELYTVDANNNEAVLVYGY